MLVIAQKMLKKEPFLSKKRPSSGKRLHDDVLRRPN